jgi:hypothetical protein
MAQANENSVSSANNGGINNGEISIIMASANQRERHQQYQ